jgi:hypothetical protein
MSTFWKDTIKVLARQHLRNNPLLLQEKVRQFTCYWRTMMYNHVTVQRHELRDCLVSPTKKKKKREREIREKAGHQFGRGRQLGSGSGSLAAAQRRRRQRQRQQ